MRAKVSVFTSLTHSLTYSLAFSACSVEWCKSVCNIYIITSSSNLYVKLNRFILFFDCSIRFNLDGAIVFTAAADVVVDLQHGLYCVRMQNRHDNFGAQQIFSVVFSKGAKDKQSNNTNNAGIFLCYTATVYSIFMCTLCTSLFIQYGLHKFVHPCRCECKQNGGNGMKINIKGNKIY